MNITIIDNFLSENYQNLIEKELMSDGFDLYMGYKGTVIPTSNCAFSDKNTVETPQLTHTFIDAGRVNNTWGIVSPIAFKLIEKLGEDYIVIKAKMNINFPSLKFGNNNYYCPHVDYPDKNCITAIYYVNDSDGDTYFFQKNGENLDVIKQISPKKGTLVYFDSNIIHSGSAPKNSDLRALINFNFKKLHEN